MRTERPKARRRAGDGPIAAPSQIEQVRGRSLLRATVEAPPAVAPVIPARSESEEAAPAAAGAETTQPAQQKARAHRDIIVIGASAGGVAALQEVVARLPEDLPATVLIVVHVPAWYPSVLPKILSRAGPLRASHARDGEAIECGRIYVAPPDHHLLISDGRLRLARGPRENHNRPAIDPLFRSAADAFGARVIGVVLSGSLGDGTAGLQAVKTAGGVAAVQDPSEAAFPDMPASALAWVKMDHCAAIEDIGPLLARLVSEEVVEMPELSTD